MLECSNVAQLPLPLSLSKFHKDSKLTRLIKAQTSNVRDLDHLSAIIEGKHDL